jgi:hypothetical protein
MLSPLSVSPDEGAHTVSLRAPSFAFLFAFALLLPGVSHAAGDDRFGFEGIFQGYDEAKGVFKIKVTKPKVSGGFGTGGVAGKPAKDLEKGQELEFQVVPEGSVLKRTVIKASSGGGLDTTGTKAGFKKAVALIPTDQDVIFSFEKNKDASVSPYLIKMIQIRLTPEEVNERLRAAGIDPAEVEEEGGGE